MCYSGYIGGSYDRVIEVYVWRDFDRFSMDLYFRALQP